MTGVPVDILHRPSTTRIVLTVYRIYLGRIDDGHLPDVGGVSENQGTKTHPGTVKISRSKVGFQWSVGRGNRLFQIGCRK